jgi:hypothetical protein
MGRDVKHFFDIAGLILNKSPIPDKWVDKARKLLIKD